MLFQSWTWTEEVEDEKDEEEDEDLLEVLLEDDSDVTLVDELLLRDLLDDGCASAHPITKKGTMRIVNLASIFFITILLWI